MIRMVVVADSVDGKPSKQFTTVPFRPLLTGLTVILDISGKLSRLESLEKVNVVVLIVTGGGAPLEPADSTGAGVYVMTDPLSEMAVNSHLKSSPVVLHISSS